MPDERAFPPDFLPRAGDYDPASEEFAQLRELLLGAERRKLAELQRRIEAQSLSAERIADLLPEAIGLRGGRDRKLARALAPTIDDAISESVRQNPREIAAAIFPVLGPAIRRAIAEALSGLVNSINRALEHSLSIRGLKWRVESWRTGVPYAQVVLRHALIYRVEQVFLIHAETGLLLAHVAPPDLRVQNADLISGMLTAIQDFVGDSFGEQESGGLRTFSVGELTVQVVQGPRAVIAAVVRGNAPDSLLARLLDSLETIHLQFAAPLADFAGDAGPFAAAHELLDDRLETVLTTDRAEQQRSRRAFLRWALPLLAVLVVVIVLMIRSDRRWNRAVARLEAEPGILVVDAVRDGGRWRFRGLRDPLASDPALVLAGIGADTARLDGRWEPYLSLEPAIVIARTQRELGSPASVAFAVRGDSLIASGQAPLSWLARVRTLGAPPSGVAAVDVSRVEGVLPPDLDQLKGSIESQQVLFDVGSAAIGPATRARLGDVAGVLRRLRESLGAVGYRAELELEGRADPTGSDALNQALSRLRTDAVQAALLRAGVPPGGLAPVALGTTRPLPGASEAERARINRSVRFTVRVVPAPEGPS